MDKDTVKLIMEECKITDKEEVRKFIQFGEIIETNGFTIEYFPVGKKDKSVGVEIWDKESPAFNNIAFNFKKTEDMVKELMKINKATAEKRVKEERKLLDSCLPNVVYNRHGKTYLYDSSREFTTVEKERCEKSIKRFDKALQAAMRLENPVNLTPEIKKETSKDKTR